MLLSKLTVKIKRPDFLAVNNDTQKITFLKTFHKNELL